MDYYISRRNKVAFLIAGTMLLMIFLWTRGTFDNVLYKVQLNYNECATNGFGATFCGDQLQEYKQRFGIS